jgi:hypothetical protein
MLRDRRTLRIREAMGHLDRERLPSGTAAWLQTAGTHESFGDREALR